MFPAGQISQYIENWRKITSDPFIRNIVSGDKREFVSYPPSQQHCPPNSFSGALFPQIKSKVEDLLLKGVIKPVEHEELEFVSPIFRVPKSDDRV